MKFFKILAFLVSFLLLIDVFFNVFDYNIKKYISLFLMLNLFLLLITNKSKKHAITNEKHKNT